MSRSLDIAKILRATEIDNPNNNRLFNSSEALGIDSAQYKVIGLTYYSTLDSLPISNLELGQRAFVNENRRLYISNGSGWYNALANISATPYWVTEPASSYDIQDSATPLIITALAADSDNPNFINQSFASDSAQYMVNITNDSSVFTFTPKSADSVGQAVAAGNLTDSNGDFEYTFKWSDGTSSVQKTTTITYQPSAVFNWGGDRAFYFGGSRTLSPLSWNGSNWVSGSYSHNLSDVQALSLVTGATASSGSWASGGSSPTVVSNGAKILTEGGFNTSGSYPYPNNWSSIHHYNPVSGSNAGSHASISNYGSTASGNIGSYWKGGGSDGINSFWLGGYYDGQNTGGSGNTNGMHLVSFATGGTTTQFGTLQNTGTYYNSAYHNNEHIWYAGTKVSMKTLGSAAASFNSPSGQYQDTCSNLTIALAHINPGGSSNTYQQVYQYDMTSGGTSSYFGNLVYGGGAGGGGNAGNSTRCAFTGGRRYSQNPPVVYADGSSTVEYFTFATQSNASSLGSTGENRYSMSGSSGNEA